MILTIKSFSYKHNALPTGPDLRIIDCRVLYNPHKIPSLRHLSGMASAVQDYVVNDTYYHMLFDQGRKAAIAGKTVAFGCFGGRHRSVAMAELVAASLKRDGIQVNVEHGML